MSASIRFFSAVAMFTATLSFAPVASALFHLFQIEQIFSNADGTVQFVVLREAVGANGENLLAGHELKATQAGVTKSYTFANDLPSSQTARRYHTRTYRNRSVVSLISDGT